MAARQPYAQMCKYPGCTQSCYVEPYGRVHDFCGRTHADEYKKKYGSYYSVGYTPHLPGFKAPSVHSSKGKSSSSGLQPVRAIHNLPGQSYSHPTYLGRSNEIKFYNRDDLYYEFTNFYPCPVQIDGYTWRTTEHYFQAQKFVGTPYVERIRRLHLPREAFQLSRDPKVSRWRRSDWESVKDDIMLKALRAKFSDQNPQLVSLLLSTGDKKLIEHTSNDSYWGDGGNGTGSNKLGQLLMRVRSELKAKTGTSFAPAVGWSQDDSVLSRTREKSNPRTPSGGSLKRSGSFSTSRGTPTPTGRGSGMWAGGVGASRQGSYAPSHPSSGGKGRSTQSPIPKPLKKPLATAKGMVASAKFQMANVMQGHSSPKDTGHKSHAKKTQSHGTTTGAHGSHRHANDSSVGYNIINHSYI